MGHTLSVQTHALLRIGSVAAVCSETALPPWASEQLRRAPWVVVRRARGQAGLVPVGVRGTRRAERCAAWVRPDGVLECVTPQLLAARRAWRACGRAAQVAALAALDDIESIMAAAGLAGCWGPAGSIAFELASGCDTASAASDVDLVVQLDAPASAATLRELLVQLGQLAVRTDVLLETPGGAVALEEYARGRVPYLARTPDGPRLLADPWARAAAAA